MERKNYYAIDIAKFISAFFVIAIHVQPFIDGNLDVNFAFVQVLARLAVPLFFTISGFLFFVKFDDGHEWNDYAHIQMLKSYVFRIFKLYLIWSILYLPFNYLLIRQDGFSIMTIVRYIRDFFLTGSYYHLWFLPSLIFAVCFVYFLRRYFSMTTTLVIGFILYIIGMIGNIYPSVLTDIPVVSSIFHNYQAIFVTTRNGLFFGTIFVALGAALVKRHRFVSSSAMIPGVGFLISLACLFAECSLLRKFGFINDMSSMYLMLLPCVAFLFNYLLALRLRKRACYKVMRIESTLIYVAHIMVVTALLLVFPAMNSVLCYALSCILTLIFTSVLYWLSTKVSVFKHLYA